MRHQKRIYINGDRSDLIGFIVCCVLIITLVMGITVSAAPLWHSEVNAARHTPGWHWTRATIINEATNNQDGNTNTRLALFSFPTSKGTRTEVDDVPAAYTTGDNFPALVSKNNQLWIPGMNNGFRSPYDTGGNFFRPGIYVTVCIFTGVIVSILIAVGILNLTENVESFLWPPKWFLRKRSQNLFGMQTREVEERILVHLPDGTFKETTTSKRL